MREAEEARRRLVFDELLRIQLALVLRKRRIEAHQPGHRARRVAASWSSGSSSALPFALTGDQRTVIGEIAADLARPVPMHRLLQGDVGAGKTVVAVARAAHRRAGRPPGRAHGARPRCWPSSTSPSIRPLLDGHRPCPTTAASLFGDRPLTVELLTNQVTGKERQRVLAGAGRRRGRHPRRHPRADPGGGRRSGSLGVVVIDEQHRFGVEQRAALRDKGAGDAVPDVLVMTATPIPRTAAMTVYGDLDVSVLGEMPAGRQRRSSPPGPRATTRRRRCGRRCARRWPPAARPTWCAR